MVCSPDNEPLDHQSDSAGDDGRLKSEDQVVIQTVSDHGEPERPDCQHLRRAPGGTAKRACAAPNPQIALKSVCVMAYLFVFRWNEFDEPIDGFV
jgi:hypothetical protein